MFLCGVSNGLTYMGSDFLVQTESDFDAKPQVMLLGQYSTGKTTFIKHLLRTSYPGAHIGPEPTTDRFVVVMVGSILSQDVTGCLYLCRHIPGNIAVCITVCLYFTFVHHTSYSLQTVCQYPNMTSSIQHNLLLFEWSILYACMMVANAMA